MKSEAGVIFSMSMAEITRLSGRNDWIKLDFVERERTPSELMQLGIRFHLAGLSLSNVIKEFESSVSDGPGKLSTIGCRRPIYSQPTMQILSLIHI